MNKIFLLNVDDFLNYSILEKEYYKEYVSANRCVSYSPNNYHQATSRETYGIDGYATLTIYHPTAKTNNESEVFRAIAEERIPSYPSLNVYDFPYVAIATNNNNEMIRDPIMVFGDFKYACVGDDAWEGDGSVIIKQALLNYRDNVRIRPVLKYDEPDEMLKYAISKMKFCQKFKNIGIIEYGYWPQNIIEEIAYREDEIEGLSKYKTGNSFTTTEKIEYNKLYCPTRFTKRDEYYINGKRCILVPDYEYRFYDPCYGNYSWEVLHPYMRERVDKEKIIYHAREVRPIIWFIDIENRIMVAADSIIHGFPVGDSVKDNKILAKDKPDKVPDVVYTFLNDTFGKEMLQTYIPLDYKQKLNEARGKLNELVKRLKVVSKEYDKQFDRFNKQKPLQNEYRDCLEDTKKITSNAVRLGNSYTKSLGR